MSVSSLLTGKGMHTLTSSNVQGRGVEPRADFDSCLLLEHGLCGFWYQEVFTLLVACVPSEHSITCDCCCHSTSVYRMLVLSLQ